MGNWYWDIMPFILYIYQTHSSISADKLYEWNIDGLSKEEIINKMNHMSMVANAYVTNHEK